MSTTIKTQSNTYDITRFYHGDEECVQIITCPCRDTRENGPCISVDRIQLTRKEALMMIQDLQNFVELD